MLFFWRHPLLLLFKGSHGLSGPLFYVQLNDMAYFLGMLTDSHDSVIDNLLQKLNAYIYG